jgi:hypothetical protein
MANAQFIRPFDWGVHTFTEILAIVNCTKHPVTERLAGHLQTRQYAHASAWPGTTLKYNSRRK